MTDPYQIEFNAANHKYLFGTGLSDEELQLLIDTYGVLCKAVWLGAEFALLAREVVKRHSELKGFQEARQKP